MLKKSLVLLLAVALMLALLPAAMAEPVSITFWHSMSDDAGVLTEQFVKDFNDTLGKEKGIKVEAVYQGKYSDATTKLNSLLSAKNVADLPDVMNLDATGKVTYFNSGHAYFVGDALKDHPEDSVIDIPGVMLKNWEFAGAQLGLPYAASTTIMFYNKTLLDQAGVAAPETFADIAALKGKLPEKTEDGNELTIYAALPNTPTLANWLGQLGSFVVDNNNGAEGIATKLVCVENGALATFLTAWKDMFEAGALKNAEGSSDVFVAGQQVLYTTSSSNIASLLNKIGDKFELGVAFYPKPTAEASFGATVSGSSVVMMDKGDEQKKAAAWELVKYLTSKEVQAQFAAGTGYTPVNQKSPETAAYQELLAKYPHYQVPFSQLQQTPVDMRSVTVGPSKDFYYAIQGSVAAMLDENWTVEETVTEMAQELNGLLDQYNKAN